MSSSSSKAHANKNFDTEKNVGAPKETRREVLVDAEEQLDAGSQGIRASLIPLITARLFWTVIVFLLERTRLRI